MDERTLQIWLCAYSIDVKYGKAEPTREAAWFAWLTQVIEANPLGE